MKERFSSVRINNPAIFNGGVRSNIGGDKQILIHTAEGDAFDFVWRGIALKT